MQSAHCAGMPNGQVMALFDDRAVCFSLRDGATFADLADGIGHLGKQHSGKPMAVYLRFGPGQQPTAMLQSGI